MESRCGMDDERGGLLGELTAGFGILLERIEELAAKNAQFERQIRIYQAEERQQQTPTKVSGTSSGTGDVVDSGKANLDWCRDPRVDRGIQAWKLLRAAGSGTVPLRNTNSRAHTNLEKPKHDDLPDTKPVPGYGDHLEQDFTTQGKRGELRCPFPILAEQPTNPIAAHVKPNLSQTIHSQNGKDHGLNGLGAAQNHEEQTGNKTASVNGSVAKCPIRYLNQMPSEDVAKYFENHKHEIPRSHEICVKRYQANEQSIRTLDAKYGSLVKMIEGLGEKHKPMLPSEFEQDEAEAIELDQKSIEKVEKWAEDCGEGLETTMREGMESDCRSEVRSGRFERPLKEVRLGESPSRPWGIQVPLTEQLGPSSAVPEIERTVLPTISGPLRGDSILNGNTAQPVGRCPFGHGGIVPPSEAHKETHPLPHVNTEAANGRMPVQEARNGEGTKEKRQVIFTGPVFFGYSAEDAAKLMETIGRS